MNERLLLIVAVAVGIILVSRFVKNKQMQQVKNTLADSKLSMETPEIIYFWSPQCQQCLNQQAPILENIYQNNERKIRKINIEKEQEEANKWKVRTVPSTYVLDKSGKILHINNGLTSEEQLLNQLAKR